MLKRTFVLCSLATLVVGSLACQTTSAGLNDSDKAAIRQDAESFSKAVNAKDWTTASARYVDDANLAPPNGSAVQGRAQIQKWMSDFPPVSEFKVELVDVDGRGDLAYVRGNYSMTVMPPGGAATKDQGKYVEIWRKQADGTWKIKWDIFNSDVPMPGESPK
jgi:uncharacterized protein (TIGR02246 family)